METASIDAANPLSFLTVIFAAVVSGNWFVAAAALLVVLVALLRKFGKQLHNYLPDDSKLDAPLYFLFDTKPGGWLLNVLTAVAGGVGTALLAGVPVTWAIIKPILSVSLSGAALWGAVKDVADWKAASPTAPAVAPVANTTDAVAELNK